MSEDESNHDKPVTVTMELNGEYGDIIGKLDTDGSERPAVASATEDFGRLLDTIEAIDGGTKSVILEHLPEDMAVTYDSETVVNALQVLERYDLVALEGNTWKIAT